jgi:hypothetical protein
MAIQPGDPEAMQLYQIIGAQLLAVVQAEVQAAQVSADFIKRVGFVTPKLVPPTVPPGGAPPPAAPAAGVKAAEDKALQDGDFVGDLKMAEFSIDRIGADNKVQPYTIKIPVLSLFPIPLLQVKDAEFEYNLRIITRVPLQSSDDEAASTSHVPSKDYLAPDRIELKGTLAPASPVTEHSSAMNIRVKISMGQADIPAGLTKLLSMADQSAGAIPGKRQV